MSDIHYNSKRHIYSNAPLITIGGPISNSVSSEISNRYGIRERDLVVGIQPNWEGRTVAYIWGKDAKSTLNAAVVFIKSYLSDFAKYL